MGNTGLYQGVYCHSFLGGTLESYRDSCPNHLLKREIIRDASERGCRYFLLGGGQHPYDNVWSYKRCFALDGNLQSLVGGTIFDHDAYNSLRDSLMAGGAGVNGERFQFYDLT